MLSAIMFMAIDRCGGDSYWNVSGNIGPVNGEKTHGDIKSFNAADSSGKVFAYDEIYLTHQLPVLPSKLS